VDARKSRAGLLLSPRSPYDGEVLGIRLGKGTAGAPTLGPHPAGRGLLVVAGTATPIQVATPL
jgi:S-DNA-T family DNA segregation ATPase FtsK/SpoIIIE